MVVISGGERTNRSGFEADRRRGGRSARGVDERPRGEGNGTKRKSSRFFGESGPGVWAKSWEAGLGFPAGPVGGRSFVNEATAFSPGSVSSVFLSPYSVEEK